jgi:hypothetical protein
MEKHPQDDDEVSAVQKEERKKQVKMMMTLITKETLSKDLFHFIGNSITLFSCLKSAIKSLLLSCLLFHNKHHDRQKRTMLVSLHTQRNMKDTCFVMYFQKRVHISMTISSLCSGSTHASLNHIRTSKIWSLLSVMTSIFSHITISVV